MNDARLLAGVRGVPAPPTAPRTPDVVLVTRDTALSQTCRDLGGIGIACAVASNYQEARALLERDPRMAMVLDGDLPASEGFPLYQLLEDSPERPALIVGGTVLEAPRGATVATPRLSAAKPLSTAALTLRIRELLLRARASQPVAPTPPAVTAPAPAVQPPREAVQPPRDHVAPVLVPARPTPPEPPLLARVAEEDSASTRTPDPDRHHERVSDSAPRHEGDLATGAQGEGTGATALATVLAGVLRRWPLVLLVLAVVMAADVAYTSTRQRTYLARATLVISPNRQTEGGQSDQVYATDSLGRGRIVGTYTEVLGSEVIQRDALQRLGYSPDALNGDVVFRSSVVADTTVVQVTVEAASPEMSAQLANTVGDLGIERMATLYPVYNLVFLTRATPPAASYRPDPIRNYSVGALLGLGLGVALAALLDLALLRRERRVARTRLRAHEAEEDGEPAPGAEDTAIALAEARGGQTHGQDVAGLAA